MKYGRLIFLGAVLSSSSLGLASSLPITKAFYCELHYSKLAYGKEVKSVFAHTGVETSCKQPFSDKMEAAYWDRVQNIDLKKTESGFQGKFITYGSSTTYAPCSLQPMAQFWLEFTDGSSRIETPAVIQITEELSRGTPVWNGGNPTLVAAVTEFKEKELRSIDTVACFSAWSYGSIIVDFNNQLLRGESL